MIRGFNVVPEEWDELAGDSKAKHMVQPGRNASPEEKKAYEEWKAMEDSKRRIQGAL